MTVIAAPARPPPLLSVRDLSVAFRSAGLDGQATETLAVDRVSFDVAPGETVALVGESGSGKSVTALSVLKLLQYPAAHHPSGQILFKGRDLLPLTENEIRRVRRRRHHDGVPGTDDVAEPAPYGRAADP